MKTPISEVVGSMPIVDAHEHHIPEVLQNRNVGLVQLLKQSYAGWTQARPYPLPGEARDLDPMLEESGPGSWSEVRAYVEGSG